MTKKRLLSGMRPTGPLHVGHYFGALLNWVAMQDEFDCFFMVADWHALTSEWKDASNIPDHTRDNVIDWLAAGVNPGRSTIFVQSSVPQHAELHLVLSCFTPVGWLERVPTYKEQTKELGSKSENYAFLGYPVLQAADILLYKGEAVPVGEDQVSHLELTREITRRFNSAVGRDLFPEPQPRLTPTPRILGPDRRKMSKSYGNVLGFADDEATLRKRVSTMITDPLRPRRSDPGHPDDCNVFTFQKLVNAPDRVPAIHAACTAGTLGCTECKGEMSAKLAEFLRPFQEKRRELLASPKTVDDILAAGNERARTVAAATMAEVREILFKKSAGSGR